jgi:AbrB family looped-hinge helix DNA binding protein
MMAEANRRATVKVGPQGRLVIPAPLRRALGIAVGDMLIASTEDNRLVLERPDAVLERLRGRFQHLPPDTSLADELISDRREEARRESEE